MKHVFQLFTPYLSTFDHLFWREMRKSLAGVKLTNANLGKI